MLPKKSHNTHQNKKLYFFIMSLGVILILCLICLFSYTNMFKEKYINGHRIKSRVIIEIFLYLTILVKLNNLFQKQEQEEKLSLSFGSKAYFIYLIFNHQLSNNPKIRVQQEKLIKQKKNIQIIKRIMEIILWFAIFMYEFHIINPKWGLFSKDLYYLYFFSGCFCLFIILNIKLYRVCGKKEALDAEDEYDQKLSSSKKKKKTNNN